MIFTSSTEACLKKYSWQNVSDYRGFRLCWAFRIRFSHDLSFLYHWIGRKKIILIQWWKLKWPSLNLVASDHDKTNQYRGHHIYQRLATEALFLVALAMFGSLIEHVTHWFGCLTNLMREEKVNDNGFLLNPPIWRVKRWELWVAREGNIISF